MDTTAWAIGVYLFTSTALGLIMTPIVLGVFFDTKENYRATFALTLVLSPVLGLPFTAIVVVYSLLSTALDMIRGNNDPL